MADFDQALDRGWIFAENLPMKYSEGEIISKSEKIVAMIGSEQHFWLRPVAGFVGDKVCLAMRKKSEYFPRSQITPWLTRRNALSIWWLHTSYSQPYRFSGHESVPSDQLKTNGNYYHGSIDYGLLITKWLKMADRDWQ